MHTCMHTFIHSYIHTLHSNIHTYIHTYIHAYMHAYIHTYIHTCLHTYIHTFTHSYIHSYIHTYIHAFIHAFIDIFIHTIIPTFLHIYIYIFTCFVQQSIPWVPRLPLDVTSPSRLSRRCRRRRTLSQPRPRPRAIWCSKWIRRRQSTPKQVWGWGRWEQLSWHLDHLGLENMEVYQGKFLNSDFFGSPHGLWHWWSLGFTRVFGTVDLSN